MRSPLPQYRLGIDTGGTFTDFVVLGPEGILVHKTPSTPADPSLAILRGLAEIFGPSLPRLEIVHGTTVGTNAFLERCGARVALLTTAGFEDVIFIGRQTRPQLFALAGEKPPPLLHRELCLGVHERLGPDGSVLVALTESEIGRLRQQIQDLPVEALAVCLLHAYVNPHHERLLATGLAGLGLPLSLSSQVLPEIREYERTSTTLINAYLGPVVGGYLTDLQHRLPDVALNIQQSNGGFLPARLAAGLAVHSIVSGPAGGVNAAWGLGQELGQARLLTFDMGGTSTDVALIDGSIPFTSEYAIDGFPIGIGVIDINTVGAGGGSIAWQDWGGALRVGPQSAGADPGPVCYGGGGKSVTVTDANLWLGRLIPDFFLGGRMTLHPEATHQAMTCLAADFAVSPAELALSLIRVANSAMAKALRAVSLERGYDPRDFTLVCFGGAGGLHVCELARELDIGRIIFPAQAGVFSALGMATARPRRDFARTVLARNPTWENLGKELETLKKQGLADLDEAGFAVADVQASLDLRYTGQGYTLNVPWGIDFVDNFHKRHQHIYGHAFPAHPVEVTTLRLHCQGESRGLVGGHVPLCRSETPVKVPDTSMVWLTEGRIKTPIWYRSALSPGMIFRGPLLILEDMATLLVLPEFDGWVDNLGHIHLQVREP
jgi:N-methylhydantoinase A